MNYRPFGSTGLQVSEIVFGCGAVGGLMINAPDEVRQDTFDFAIAQGVNWFDTAAAYGQGLSETHLGLVLSQAEKPPHVSTKFTVDTRNDDYFSQATASLEGSLTRLNRDSVTLLQIHNPIGATTDKRTLGIDEILRSGGVLDAMHKLKERGLCKHIGITALGNPAAIIQAVTSGRVDSAQVYYNLLNASAGTTLPASWPHYSFAGLMGACAEHGVATMNIRVFSAGVIATDSRHGRERPLTAGDTVDSETAKARHVFRALPDVTEARAQTAVRFSLSRQDLACVVVGIGEKQHLREALAAAESGPLAAGTMTSIENAWASFDASQLPE